MKLRGPALSRPTNSQPRVQPPYNTPCYDRPLIWNKSAFACIHYTRTRPTHSTPKLDEETALRSSRARPITGPRRPARGPGRPARQARGLPGGTIVEAIGRVTVKYRIMLFRADAASMEFSPALSEGTGESTRMHVKSNGLVIRSRPWTETVAAPGHEASSVSQLIFP